MFSTKSNEPDKTKKIKKEAPKVKKVENKT